MKNEKEIVKVMLDFLQGPIWTSDFETGEPLTGVDVIDKDALIKELNYIASHMYAEYYEFDSHDMPCWFNYEKEKEEKEIMLDLITRIVARLNEINDGSFVIEDYVSEYLKTL